MTNAAERLTRTSRVQHHAGQEYSDGDSVLLLDPAERSRNAHASFTDESAGTTSKTGWYASPIVNKVILLIVVIMIGITFGIVCFLLSKQDELRDALVSIQTNQLLLSYELENSATTALSLTNSWGEESLLAFCHLLEFTCDDAEYLTKRNSVPNNNQFCSKVKNACNTLILQSASTPISPHISINGLFRTLGGIPPGRLFNRPGQASLLEGALLEPNGAKLIQTGQLGMFVAFSYYGVTGITDPEVNDGVAWITLNSSLPLASAVSYLYNSEKRGGFNNIYANLDRVIIPSPGTNEVFVIDISTGISNIKSTSFITSSTISTDANVSRPWAAHAMSDGKILVSALEDVGGGGNGGLFTIDYSSGTNVVERWDSTVDPLAGSRATPGDFCVLDAESNFVQVGSLAPWTTVLADPDVCFQTGDLSLYGRQINLFNSETRTIEAQLESDTTDITDSIGPVRAIPAFDDYIGAIPTILRKDPNNPEIFGFASMYTGTIGIGVYTGATNSQPWTLTWTTQIPPLADPTDPSNVNASKLPLITDASFDKSGMFLMVAVHGLGQIRIYSVEDSSLPRLCDVVQVTAGQNLFDGQNFTNPSCPGRILDKGPAHITPDPYGDFIYVSSNYIGITECAYPDSANTGGWLVRYRLDTQCQHGMMTQDPGFCISGNALPGIFNQNPAKIGDIIFPSGDIKNPTRDTHPYSA